MGTAWSTPLKKVSGGRETVPSCITMLGQPFAKVGYNVAMLGWKAIANSRIFWMVWIRCHGSYNSDIT